ncbi:DUF262 domain-containing protein [Mesorhizobium sp. M0293]|uniref:DUF262 domain-containing protein n=1 Tax=Mesorhizobium sp. M0293 TaxID=2956930 RepID=UPI00333E0AEC
MPLAEEISSARKLIYRDGYDMSFGEISTLYEKDELVINPEYQRLFRWEETQKTRFIESLLLNIPIPPIFVFTRPNGKWELVDGLQRVSTLLQFLGILREEASFVCDGTNLLPSLTGVRWPTKEEQDIDGANLPVDVLSPAHQLTIKRSRVRVEILGPETDATVKFELFQRLNTGGSNLSEQEIRNCIIFSLRPELLISLRNLSQDDNFTEMVPVGGVRESRQYLTELVLRILVYRNFPYNSRLDVHEYLDKSSIAICENSAFDIDAELNVIRGAFDIIWQAKESEAFEKNNRFSLAYYEFICLGVSKYIDRGGDDVDFVRQRIDDIPNHPQIEQNTGAGVRGTQRLSNLIFASAEQFFQQ